MRKLQCPPKSRHKMDRASEAVKVAEASQPFIDEQHGGFAAALIDFGNGAIKRERNKR